MRIRPPSFRAVAFSAAVATIVLLAIETPSAAQDAAAADASGAVNQGSATTERILSELRAGNDGANASDSSPETAAGDDAAGPVGQTQPGALSAKLRTDGSLAEPAVDSTTQDGLLRDQQTAVPADGDLSADGKIVAPTDALADQTDAGASGAAAPANARVIDGETDARTAAGRPRPVAEDGAGAIAPAPAPVAPIDDTTPEDASSLDVAADQPVLRRAVVDVEADPYAAVGYRVGGFLVLPTITADTLFSDNVLQSSSDRQSDVAVVLRPGLSLQSQWSRHSLSLDLRGVTTTYANLHSQDGNELHANLRGRLDLTSRSSLEAEAGFDYSLVSRSDPSLAAGAVLRPITRTDSLGLAYNQTFDRLTLRLHGATAETVQGVSGNGAEQYIDSGLDFRAGYELSPKLTVFGAAKAFDRNYANASGIDATGDDVRVGVETDRSAKLSATASIGGANIGAASGNSAGDSGAVADASVTWLPSALTTVNFAALTDLELTDAAGSAAMRNSQVSLEIKHQFRRWLALLAGISEAKRAYAGIGLTELQRTSHIGFEYDFTREWALLGNYQRTDLSSSDASRAYSEDQVTLGVRLQR